MTPIEKHEWYEWGESMRELGRTLERRDWQHRRAQRRRAVTLMGALVTIASGLAVLIAYVVKTDWPEPFLIRIFGPNAIP